MKQTQLTLLEVPETGTSAPQIARELVRSEQMLSRVGRMWQSCANKARELKGKLANSLGRASETESAEAHSIIAGYYTPTQHREFNALWVQGQLRLP